MNARRSLRLLLVLATAHAAGAASWNASCCTVFRALTRNTVERTGSALTDAECRADETQCMKLRPIVVFIEQSRSILGRDGVETSADAMRFNIASAELSSADSFLELLAWAFIGRVVALPTATPDINRQSVALQYDIHENELRVKRDSCETDKILYNAMVVGSVTILIFFISAMVVEKKRHAKTEERGAGAITKPQAAELRLRLNAASPTSVFAPLLPAPRSSREAFHFR